MKVYRGPDSKPFYDESHEYVSTISSAQLKRGIEENLHIRFNVTKDGYERRSVCTAHFEESDIIPMIDGLLSRLKKSQETLDRVRAAMANETLDEMGKLREITSALSQR